MCLSVVRFSGGSSYIYHLNIAEYTHTTHSMHCMLEALQSVGQGMCLKWSSDSTLDIRPENVYNLVGVCVCTGVCTYCVWVVCVLFPFLFVGICDLLPN